MVDVQNPRDVKRRHQIPKNLYSCHTGFVSGYYLEGHIPAEDIQRLLKEKPAIRGLAVPGMPTGSPGMEGEPKQKYQVYAIDNGGNISVYANH